MKIHKGVDERINYVLPIDQDYIFDLRFEYPMNFFSGKIANRTIYEKKFDNKHEILDINQSIVESK